MILLSISSGYTIAQERRSTSLSELDQKLKSGFEFLENNKLAQARISFDEAYRMIEKQPDISEYLIKKLAMPGDDPDYIPRTREEALIIGHRYSMGTKQAIVSFLAFVSQIEGRTAEAEKHFDSIYGLQGVLWGRSWVEYMPQIQAVFHLSIPERKGENYGRYLYMAGRLMLSSEQDEIGFKLLEEARQMVPKDPEIPAYLAGNYVIRGDAANAKKYGELSLTLDPKQKRVHIDLATANWLAGDLEAAVKHANEAISIDPGMPGPYATLALVALEKGTIAVSIKEAEIGNKLSNGHAYYRSVLAACLAADGKTSAAKKHLLEAWKDDLPDEKRLRAWFFRGKALDSVLKLLKSA